MKISSNRGIRHTQNVDSTVVCYDKKNKVGIVFIIVTIFGVCRLLTSDFFIVLHRNGCVDKSVAIR